VIDTAECFADGESAHWKGDCPNRRAEVVFDDESAGMRPLGLWVRAPAGYRGRRTGAPRCLRGVSSAVLKNLPTDHIDVMQFHSPPLETLKDGPVTEVSKGARNADRRRFIGMQYDSDHAVVRGRKRRVFDTCRSR